MTAASRHTWGTLAVLGGGGLVVWWVLRGNTGPAAAPISVTVPTSGAGPGGIPANVYNLSFQSPSIPTYGQLRGYVPLFGFIGTGAQMA